jgi:NADPH:quinone reductase-like Zn-dependent oxidoreductase
VQLAKNFGVEVTGVCSTRNIKLVKSLGADQVIDYTKEDFTESNQTYDIIFDAVMKTSFSRCKDSLKQNGTFITVDWPLLQVLWTSIAGTKKVVIGIASRIEDLIYLRELIEAGKVISVIDRCYPLEETADAHRYAETGHKKGNVVITVEHSNNT